MILRRIIIVGILTLIFHSELNGQVIDSSFNLSAIVYDGSFRPVPASHVINMNTHQGDVTDSLGNSTKYRLPSHSPKLTTIPAKSFYILYADNKEMDEVNHTSFKLSRSGEQVALIHYDQETILDSISFKEQFKKPYEKSKLPTEFEYLGIISKQNYLSKTTKKIKNKNE